MKNRNKYLVAVSLAIIVMGLWNCTKHDQVLDLTTTIPAATSGVGDTLMALHVGAVPTLLAQSTPGGSAATLWNGTIDAAWNNAKKLTVHATVPDLGVGTFTGYVGNSTDITMRSMYDGTYINFLVEFDAAQKNVKSAQWYFNPTQTDKTKRWAQEATVPALNADGVTFRPPAAQDQLVIMFNVANSCKTFNALSCYAACHAYSPYGTATPAASGVMYTNGPTEILDVWRARMLQVMNTNQANDCFIDDGTSALSAGTLNKNEVHNDWQIHNGPTATQHPTTQVADGGLSNKQSIKITGMNTKATVPLWAIPNASTSTYANYSAIMPSDTLPTTGKALKVMKVDSFGVLTLSDNSIIDPRIGTAYQQIGAGDGAKSIPGSIVDAYTGSRGDVTVNAFHTGTGWRILLQRKLSTTDADGYDVDFKNQTNMPFGIGAMFNGADNEHAIVAGLTLHFQK